VLPKSQLLASLCDRAGSLVHTSGAIAPKVLRRTGRQCSIMQGMLKSLLIAALWGLATSTWASMLHVLFGLGDIGAITGITAACAAVIVRSQVWSSVGRARGADRSPALMKR
jgi:hypothetical protein